MRGRVATWVLVLSLAACGGQAAAPVPATTPAPVVTPVEDAASIALETRAWLAHALTCGDREFLRLPQPEQRKRLQHMDGVACTPAGDNSALRCAITPALRIGNADVDWFVLGQASAGVAPVILPAPQDTLRTVVPAGAGVIASGTDLGDARLECGLDDGALTPGAVAGLVQGVRDPQATARVCAFELNDGVATCTRTGRGARAYRIEGLARGDYVVLAIPGNAPDTRIGYTDCVDDDAASDTPCTHELKIVAVRAGRTSDAIDPADVRTLDEAGSWPQPPPSE